MSAQSDVFPAVFDHGLRCRRVAPSPNVLNASFSKVFLGETEGSFLGADLRT